MGEDRLTGGGIAEKLARLLRGENRQNLTEEEALAIGDSVLNRTDYAGYPDTVEDILAQQRGGKYQFVPFDPTNPNFSVINEFGPGHPEWETYMAYVGRILDPKRPRGPYTNYFAGKPPKWAVGLEGLTKIGSHTFGVDTKRRKKKRAAK